MVDTRGSRKTGTAGANATYTGYIWNRTGTNVNWTFAMSAQQFTRMDIDGVEVMRQRRKNPADSTPNDAEQKFETITLTPGPHQVHIRCFIDKLFGDGVKWPKNFGFVYDKQGRTVNTNDFTGGNYSSITNHFDLVIDSGDGSLFTRSVDEADLPHFDEMRFAEGTTLDLNGNAYVARSISGFPTVTSTATDASAAPSLTIGNRFIVNAVDIAAGKKLSLAMPLSFGETGGVAVTNLAALAGGTYTLAEVTGSNTISVGDGFLQNCGVDNSKWTVSVSSDKKRIELSAAPSRGFKIILKP